MAKVIDINTKKIENCGTDIMQLAVDYSEQINGLFDDLQKVSWTGSSAEEFVRRVKFEKIQYIKLKNNMYKEGKFLRNCALRIEEVTKDLKR